MSNPSHPDEFDAYRVWLGIPKAEQPPNHYRLLGIVQFEDDPQVILEGADRQVAHLKNKQTGQRVALSQKLLQEVAAAAGCLLDPDAKAEYDAQLRTKLAPAAPPKPVADEPKPVPVPAPPPPAAYYAPPPAPIPPAPVYQAPVYHVPPAVAPAPIYQQPLPPALLPQAVAPLRPIPVPVPTTAEQEEPDDFAPTPKIGVLHGASTRSSARGRSSSGDTTKLIVGGGVGLLLLIVAWTILSRPEISAGLFAERPVPSSKPVKPKPAIKPAAVNESSAVTPKPATEPVTNPVTPKEPVKNETPTSPTTKPEPTPPVVTPSPSPSETPVTPSTPTPVTPTPPATNPTSPSETPAIPAPEKPAERTLWRYPGGFIERESDGTWKELSPSGDYFTLTPIGSVNLTSGQMPEMLEFERPAGPGRLRVYDNRLEMNEGLSGLFAEVAKGTWGLPAEDLELDPQPKAMLQQACQRYAEAIARARKKLLIQFDQALTGNKRVGKAEEQLALIELLTAEKKRFEETGLVPWSAPMQADTAKYLIELMQARGPSEALFEKAAAHYVMHKDPDKASSVIALKNKVLAPQVIAKLSIADAPRTPRPTGFGFPRRRDDELPEDDNTYPQDPRIGTVRLWSNGAVNHAGGKSSWTLTSTNLVLNFVRPTHTVRDTVGFSDRGDEISGKAVFSNNYSLNFSGRVLGDLADHERRPEVKFAPPKSEAQ